MSDDRWVPWPQGAPTNEHVAEVLGLAAQEVATYRLETIREGNVWRVYLGREILSPSRATNPGEKIPARLVAEITIDE